MANGLQNIIVPRALCRSFCFAGCGVGYWAIFVAIMHLESNNKSLYRKNTINNE